MSTVKTGLIGLIGAIVGSFSMTVFAGTHPAAPSEAATAPIKVPSNDFRSQSSDQARIVAAVKHDEPSVVALDVTVNGREYVPPDPFMQFFGFPSEGGGVRQFRERASGSGFVYSKDGLIVTNAHVVQFGRGTNVKITAIFANGDHVPAHVYAVNPAADLA